MKIGISGARGHLGTTILKALIERAGGHEIIGISRTPEKLLAPVSGRFGVYNKPELLADAYAGLDRLLIIPTTDLAPGVRGGQSIAAIDAAVAAGVGQIVIVSSAGTRAEQEPHILASYYAGEQRLMRTAAKWSITRMNYYAEALIDEAKMSLGQGVLVGLAENKVTFVSRNDLAAAAAGLLVGEGHEGAIYNATGLASITGAERAAIIAKAAGQPLAFTVLPQEILRDGLEQAGLPADIVNAVIGIQETFAAGGFEREGLVTRTVFPTIPPRVDYELTPLGSSLWEPVEALGLWAQAHQGEIAKARAIFDRQQQRQALPSGR